MKSNIFKPIISIMAITLIALIYVHQQIETVKLSYTLGVKENNLERMLDRREALRYNIKALENPSRLEKVLLSRNIYTAFPRKAQIVNMITTRPAANTPEPVRAAGIEKKIVYPKIFEFLGLRAEAQAKEK